MARRKSKAKQQEELFQAPLGAAFVFPALGIFSATGSLGTAITAGVLCSVNVNSPYFPRVTSVIPLYPTVITHRRLNRLIPRSKSLIQRIRKTA